MAHVLVVIDGAEVRELWIGGSTVKAILGQRLVPAYADWRLASMAWEGQMTDEPQPPGRRDDVDEPLPGDRGARGRFRARTWSAQLAARLHPAAALLLLAAAAGAGAWTVRAAR